MREKRRKCVADPHGRMTRAIPRLRECTRKITARNHRQVNVAEALRAIRCLRACRCTRVNQSVPERDRGVLTDVVEQGKLVQAQDVRDHAVVADERGCTWYSPAVANKLGIVVDQFAVECCWRCKVAACDGHFDLRELLAHAASGTLEVWIVGWASRIDLTP